MSTNNIKKKAKSLQEGARDSAQRKPKSILHLYKKEVVKVQEAAF